jgi:AcrR family transcriptional regulator
MRQNPARRAALLDAAIEVLARDGARGLTFRAVDAEAGVPVGTASNYFPNRDEMLSQAARHIHHRLWATPEEMDGYARAEPSPELAEVMLRAMLRRIDVDRAAYLALLELRLEATRRPALRAALTETVRANFAENVTAYREFGLPGGMATIVLLYYAMSGLITERLTLPDAVTALPAEEVIAALVAHVVPRPHETPGEAPGETPGEAPGDAPGAGQGSGPG